MDRCPQPARVKPNPAGAYARWWPPVPDASAWKWETDLLVVLGFVRHEGRVKSKDPCTDHYGNQRRHARSRDGPGNGQAGLLEKKRGRDRPQGRNPAGGRDRQGGNGN